MKLTLAALALLCASCCVAKVPSAQLPRHVQEKMLNIGSSARYGPHVLSYSRRPFGQPRRGSLEPPSTPRAPEDYKLPTRVTPLSYDISLIPYLETPPAPASPFTFDGEVTIRIRAREPTFRIVMHAWDLTVSQIAVLRIRDGAVLTVTDYLITTNDTNFFTIDLATALEAGQEYNVIVFFKGVLNSEGYGFFRSQWTDENGNLKWLAATQFESHAARRAFPCFDQPDMKAAFTINIAQEPNFKALANMPLSSEGDPVEGLPGWTWARFQPSVPMSSYLVAFTTSEFMAVTNGIYSVWARPEVYLTGDYALQFSPQVVSYFEGFTGHLYSLPKMDQFSMTDFFSGAMENWGLITYLEPYVLHDPREDDASWKQVTTQVIAHEIAHQWFGDLVSPQWWSSLWLNEGFATYFEYFGVDGVNPDWQMREQFVVDNMHYSFRTDDDRSHPIYWDTVDSPSSTDAMFDSITYSKGGCIVRFMVEFLGESNFKAGINEYLTTYGFGAANQYDLFNVLTPHAPPNMPVTFTELMDSWTTQAGYPILTVQRNYFEQSATIVQRRFGFAGTEKWIVPVTMTRGDAPDFTSQQAKAWLLPQDSFLYLSSTLVPGSQDWFLINIAQTGFYRVNYDTGNWRLLTDALKADASVFNEINRAQLMDDAHVFAIDGLLDYDSALRTTDYLAQETRFVPWEVATYALEYIRDRMYQDLTRVQSFNTYMQQRIITVYNSVSGFNQQPTDSLGTMVTRRLITRWACNSRLAVCNTDGAAVYSVWRGSANPDTNNPIPLELRTPSYCAGHRANGADARQFLLDRYAAATSSDERDRLIYGMGCSDDAALLQSYLDLSITTTIQAGDRLSVFIAVHSHPEGINLAYDFLLLNWREIDVFYGRVGSAFVTISDQLNTQAQYDSMVQFRADNAAELGPINTNLIDSAISTLGDILTWNSNNLDTVTNYFNNAQ